MVVPAPLAAERLVEVGVAVAFAVLMAPLLVAVVVLIRVADGSPVLHRSTRVGRDGVPFTLYKFRTMRPGAGAPITAQDDPRITRIGAVLRRWKLDELPQLWNVMTGDMSLVGPRPEDPRYVAAYTPAQLRLLSVRPGVTSRATMASLREEEMLAGAPDPERVYVEEILPAKLALDLEWLANRSKRGDARILVATFRRMVTSR